MLHTFMYLMIGLCVSKRSNFQRRWHASTGARKKILRHETAEVSGAGCEFLRFYVAAVRLPSERGGNVHRAQQTDFTSDPAFYSRKRWSFAVRSFLAPVSPGKYKFNDEMAERRKSWYPADVEIASHR